MVEQVDQQLVDVHPHGANHFAIMPDRLPAAPEHTLHRLVPQPRIGQPPAASHAAANAGTRPRSR